MREPVTAFAIVQASTLIDGEDFNWVIEPATEGSLAVCAARDDTLWTLNLLPGHIDYEPVPHIAFEHPLICFINLIHLD